MDTVHLPSAVRSTGALWARILLVLTAIAAAFTVTVVGAEPAGAYTIERSPNEIVIRSDRLHDNQTHATVIVTLRPSGDNTVRVEAHNTARTRKFVWATATVRSPAANVILSPGSGGCRRVDSGEWDEWEHSNAPSEVLAARWHQVVNDPNLSASLTMWAYRTDC